ncbi:putative anucleate primary sterigmata protein b protein [Eutypa lata UCREL1]|uniref:Putative anucleate primary sterigmata protein b protein n=1 Tax=Eutypa lata (strain UCR-EL1) TaxID=1287681 RepID=M7SAS5_EUTLA|nr:putative anucleate primary sterigmata protein b protein [Eutypa lata UCREL1]
MEDDENQSLVQDQNQNHPDIDIHIEAPSTQLEIEPEMETRTEHQLPPLPSPSPSPSPSPALSRSPNEQHTEHDEHSEHVEQHEQRGHYDEHHSEHHDQHHDEQDDEQRDEQQGENQEPDQADDGPTENSISAIDQEAEAQPQLPPPQQLLQPPKQQGLAPDSSLYEVTAIDQEDKHPNSMTEEQQVMAHLQDVESSFVPPISPIPVAGPEGGIDDTYLFDVSPTKRNPTQAPIPLSLPHHESESEPESQRHAEETSFEATADAGQNQPARTTPKPPRHATLPNRHEQRNVYADKGDTSVNTTADDSIDIGNTTSSLENLTSSPSATAAAARSVSRAISMASNRPEYIKEEDSVNENTEANSSNLQPRSLPQLPPTSHATSTAAVSTRHQPSDVELPKLTLDTGSAAGDSQTIGNRPKFLRSRNASQRSSTSSFASHDDDVDIDSEVTVGLGVDYALQSGGAVPAHGMSRSLSDSLSRSISMGSMASGIDDYPDSGLIQPLEPLKENVKTTFGNVENEDFVKTPRAKKQGPLLAPTDTVIARHVRNVEVPESLAKEYKTKGGLSTPIQPHRKIHDYTPIPGTHNRNGRNMTLKEQSSTIERLSKENFDLKLKVMFLSDRLDKLSEEGIKEMISENVELKTSLAVIQRDNKVLRRRVKELEKTLRDRSEEDRPSTARSGYSSDGRTTPVFDEHAQEREEELLYLRERVEEYVTEIERLRSDNMTNQSEKRKLAEALKTMGDRAGDRVGDNLGEQLRHENAELRREVGAQTSMLTSRNREKERLYQEIEDLKLAQRRGGPAPSTVDSLLERSASRTGNNERPNSRASGRTRLAMTVEEDPDREELENKLAVQRDKYNELKMKHQDIQRELDACVQDYEAAMQEKQQTESRVATLEEELENSNNDAIALQNERDEALRDCESLEEQFENLRQEAQEEIDILENEGDQKAEENHRLQLELQDRTENFEALQDEMRQMSEALVGLEDEQEKKHNRIQQLEGDLAEANKELEDLEAKLLEANDKGQRLSVQQESLQDEITFLREEQENDKVRIGNLEADLAAVEQSLRDEQDHVRELEQRIAEERQQREIVADREKEEVQQFVNELNREASGAKDEVRRLRKSLSSREIEAAEWKERLMEFESNLREALGDLNGTRSSFLRDIANLQRTLDDTVRELDTARASLLEKDRIIKQRDALLESHGLESRKLADMLDKERQGHRNTKNQFDTFQRTHSHVSRTVTSQDSRIQELEISRATDKKKMAHLEGQFKEQLIERNNLLLILWTRLSALCGTDWAHNNSLINGRALPSLESVSTMLPGFSKNLLGAIKTIEGMIGGFHASIKAVERDLWKEYHALETTLDSRSKKLDRLEALVRSGVAAGGGSFDLHAKYTQLEAAFRTLKIENATLQRAHDARTRGGYYDPAATSIKRSSSREDTEGGSPSPLVPTGPHHRDATAATATTPTGGSKIPRSKTTQTHLEPIPPPTSNSRPGSKRASSMTNVPRRSNTTTTMNSSSTNNNTEYASERMGTMSSSSGHHRRDRDRERDEDAPRGRGAGSRGPSPSSGGGGGGGMDSDTRFMFRLRELEGKLKQEREARNMDRAAAKQRILDSERQNSELAGELARAKRKEGIN